MGVLALPTRVYDALPPTSLELAIVVHFYRKAAWRRQVFYWVQGKREIDLERGDTFATYRYLANRFNVGVGKIRGALERLTRLGFISGLIQRGVTIWRLTFFADADGKQLDKALEANRKAEEGQLTQTKSAPKHPPAKASTSLEDSEQLSLRADIEHESDQANLKSDHSSTTFQPVAEKNDDDVILEFLSAYNDIAATAGWSSASLRAEHDRNRLRLICKAYSLEEWRSILEAAVRSDWFKKKLFGKLGIRFFLDIEKLHQMMDGGN